MLDRNKRITLTVVVLLAIIALITGLFVSQYMFSQTKFDMSDFHGTYLEKPREINHFSLTGTDQKPFNNASLQGQWTMVFFGFTSCGSICPTTMAELGKMYKLMQEQGVKTLPSVVMISVDPARDSVEKLAHYVKAYNPRFYGARGDEDTINVMTQEMGIAYAKVALPNPVDAQNYDIEHTGTIILFNPQGQLIAFFTTPHQAEWLAKDYRMLAENNKQLA